MVFGENGRRAEELARSDERLLSFLQKRKNYDYAAQVAAEISKTPPAKLPKTHRRVAPPLQPRRARILSLTLRAAHRQHQPRRIYSKHSSAIAGALGAWNQGTRGGFNDPPF